MTIYTVHRRPGEAADRARFVPDGFSFGAFVFTVFWAAWHRMWLVAALLLAIFAAIAVAGYGLGLPDIVVTLINLAVALIFGFEARDLQRRALSAVGRREVALASGRRLEEAELQYFLDEPDKPAAVAPVLVRAGGPQHDALGLFGNV